MIHVEQVLSHRQRPVRDYARLDTIAVHRTGWHSKELFIDHGYLPNPESLDKFYASVGVTWPYTFTVGFQGQVWQSYLIEAATPHAGAFNVPAIGVAVIGDFRFTPPTTPQYDALTHLLARLCRWRPLAIKGHAPELGPRATSDPTKRCPGALLSMDQLRRDVALLAEVRGTEDLRNAGVAI
jgi:hypothetical protein